MFLTYLRRGLLPRINFEKKKIRKSFAIVIYRYSCDSVSLKSTTRYLVKHEKKMKIIWYNHIREAIIKK